MTKEYDANDKFRGTTDAATLKAAAEFAKKIKETEKAKKEDK